MALEELIDFNTVPMVKLGGNNTDGTPNPVELAGFFLGTQVTKKVDKKGNEEITVKHFFRLENGDTVGVWGKTRLNNLIAQYSDLKGQYCVVTFTGMAPPAVRGH